MTEGDVTANPDVRRPWDAKGNGAHAGWRPADIPERHEVEIPEDFAAEVEGFMARYPDRHSAVLPALHAAQDRFGWLRQDVMLMIAAIMRVTPAYLESVATFYDMLKLRPTGRHLIMVCHSLACHVRGGERMVERFQKELDVDDDGVSPDGEFEIQRFECLGGCDMAPVASIDGHYRGPLEPDDVPTIIENVRSGAEDPLPGRIVVGDGGRRAEREAAEREKQEQKGKKEKKEKGAGK